MRIYISADIEGVTGSITWDEGSADKPEYAYFQQQMTQEVAAACKGALDAGADEVLVKDAHYTARNIIPDMLPEGTKLLRGWTEEAEMMVAGIQDGFDAAVFIGFHAPSGSKSSPLSHTMDPKIQSITCNGKAISEFDLSAMTAAYYNVPVVFLSGDAAICSIAQSAIPAISTVTTNEGRGSGAVCIHPHTAIARIQSTVQEAVQQLQTGAKPSCMYPLPKHFRFEICFQEHTRASRAMNYPGITRKNDTTVVYETADYQDVLKMSFWLL